MSTSTEFCYRGANCQCGNPCHVGQAAKPPVAKTTRFHDCVDCKRETNSNYSTADGKTDHRCWRCYIKLPEKMKSEFGKKQSELIKWQVEHQARETAVALDKQQHQQETHEAAQRETPSGGGKLKYPELAFPRDAVLVPGSNLEYLVSYACKGGDGTPYVLDPGLVTEAILTLASGLPYEDEMLETRLTRYSVLLAMSRAGKGMAWKRATATLGLREKDDFNYYDPSGHVQMIHELGDRYEGKKPDQTHIAGAKKMVWITEELSGCLKMASSDGSKIMQQLLQFYDRNMFAHTDVKTGRVCKMDCRLSWGTCLAVGYGKIEERKFSGTFTDVSNDGLIGRMFFGFSEQEVDPRDLEGWEAPSLEHTTAEIAGMGTIDHYGSHAGQKIASHVVKGYEDGVFKAYRDCVMPRDLEFPGWQFALKKNMVHIALVNLHTNVTMDDFNAAVAYTKWQGSLRKVFLASQADDDKQARFNERVIRALRKADQVLAKAGKDIPDRLVYVPRIAQRHEWATAAKSVPLDRTILELANMGVLKVDTKTNEHGNEVRDWEHVWVRHDEHGECWCGGNHGR